MPPDAAMTRALDDARLSFERCALDSRLPETAFHTLTLRIATEDRRIRDIRWSEPFIGPTADRLLRCMGTIARVALRPQGVIARGSYVLRYVPLRDLDYPMQPPPAPVARAMDEAEAQAFVQRLTQLASDAERFALLEAQEEAHVAIPVGAVAAVLAAFDAPDLRVGSELCRVVSGRRVLARVTRGLRGPDARRLRALSRGRCGVDVP
jgi:hypothetical protein